jgi:hypothetical protein
MSNSARICHSGFGFAASELLTMPDPEAQAGLHHSQPSASA